MQFRLLCAMLPVFMVALGVPVYAADDLIEKDLPKIGEFAEELCQTAPPESSMSIKKFEGEIGSDILSFLQTTLGGTYVSENRETVGVLQRDLAGLLLESLDCRREVFDRLLTYMEAEQQNSEGKQSPDEWVPIYGGIEIKFVPLCREESVECRYPSRSDYTRYGYRQSTIFLDGSSYTVISPEYIGRTSVGTDGLTFEYLDYSDSQLVEYYSEIFAIDVSEFGDIEVCFCYEQDM